MTALADLKQRVDLVDIIRRHVELKRQGHRLWGLCPFHRDKTPSLMVEPDRFRCWACGAHGDVVDFVAKMEGLDTKGAVARLRELVGTAPATRPRRRRLILEPPPAVPAPSGFTAAARRYLASCRPLATDGLVARYLARRGCAMPENDVMERHADRHPSGYIGPVMVAVITDPVTGERLSLHRTWLAHDGTGKAPVKKPRLVWPGLSSRGVVRLFDDAEVTLGLCIAEGIETALTAARGYGPAVWACLNAGNMKVLPVLPGVEALTVVSDHDPAGIVARDACTERWLAAGVEVVNWTAPNRGVDLNDYAAAAPC